MANIALCFSQQISLIYIHIYIYNYYMLFVFGFIVGSTRVRIWSTELAIPDHTSSHTVVHII